jgi:hypothetical protein
VFANLFGLIKLFASFHNSTCGIYQIGFATKNGTCRPKNAKPFLLLLKDSTEKNLSVERKEMYILCVRFAHTQDIVSLFLRLSFSQGSLQIASKPDVRDWP